MRSYLTLAACVVALSAAAVKAQEPLRLPAPQAKALEGEAVVSQGDGGAIAEDEVVGDGHVGGGVAGDGAFGGYPYNQQWHAGYQHPLWGRPVALVVPPNSHYQTIYSWGVATTQMAPIYPQFNGPANGVGMNGAGQYQMPPYWPWDTRQFGAYYIRGPW